MLHDNSLKIANNIVVSFYISRLLKYDKKFGAWYLSGKIKLPLTQNFVGGQYMPDLVSEFYVSSELSFFMTQ